MVFGFYCVLGFLGTRGGSKKSLQKAVQLKVSPATKLLVLLQHPKPSLREMAAAAIGTTALAAKEAFLETVLEAGEAVQQNLQTRRAYGIIPIALERRGDDRKYIMRLSPVLCRNWHAPGPDDFSASSSGRSHLSGSGRGPPGSRNKGSLHATCGSVKPVFQKTILTFQTGTLLGTTFEGAAERFPSYRS